MGIKKNRAALTNSDLSAEYIMSALRISAEAARLSDVSIGKPVEWHTCMILISQKRFKVSFIERGQDVKPELFDNPIKAGLRTIERSDCSKLRKCRTRRLFKSRLKEALE